RVPGGGEDRKALPCLRAFEADTDQSVATRGLRKEVRIMKSFWDQAILAPLRELGQQAMTSLSSLLGMLALVLLGLVVGWLAKEVVYRVLRTLRFDRLCGRLGVDQEIERMGFGHSCSYLAGQVVQGI